jgi:2-oxoglutarate dehydrogenase E2 component (dihydrolipoamide succinyltransferase)
MRGHRWSAGASGDIQMALIDVKVPQLSESVAEATLLTWKKKPGEAVAVDEILVEIETDKVVLEVPAPAAGVMAQLVVNDGENCVSDQVIARIDTEGSTAVSPLAVKAVEAPAAAPAAAAAAPVATGGSKSDVAMPAAAKLLADNGLAVGDVAGSGKDGRVTKGDVLAAVAGGAKPAPAAVVAAPAIPTGVPSKSLPAVQAPNVPNTLGERPEQRVPMSRLRARVAERLLQSQATNAILTTFNEVNMAPVMEMRKKFQEKFEKEHGFDIGVAVGSPRGLVVPVLRNADQMTFAEIEKKIAEFGNKARDGKLGLDDLTGGTFSISNGGTFGSMLSTPIINPPQSAILGVHATKDRPVVENGQIVIRPINYLAMSYDHRIIDGREAVLGLVAMKEALEDPARLLFDL